MGKLTEILQNNLSFIEYFFLKFRIKAKVIFYKSLHENIIKKNNVTFSLYVFLKRLINIKVKIYYVKNFMSFQ